VCEVFEVNKEHKKTPPIRTSPSFSPFFPFYIQTSINSQMVELGCGRREEKNLSSNKKAQKGNVQMIKTGKDKHNKAIFKQHILNK